MTPPLAAVVSGAALVGAVSGLLVPRVVAAIPEPDAGSGDGADKLPYATIAAVPRLGLWCALTAAAACGVAAWSIGWSAALPTWIYLGVVGVALGYVDWRTRLLPTRLVGPSYVVVAALAVLASAVTGDWGSLLRAAIGWALAGGLYFVLWFIHPKGMGYGDVRLSGVLGIALGWLGWGELVVGVYSGFLLGAVVGGLLAVFKIVDAKRYAFGPFMLLGALLGVVTGDLVADWYVG